MNGLVEILRVFTVTVVTDEDEHEELYGSTVCLN
jgi:hypothetical protein